MNFIEIPNLPEKPVCLAVADERISAASERTLERLGVRLLKTRRHPGLYEAVSSHPDMLLHPIGGNRIVHAPGIGAELASQLAEAGFRLICGDTELAPQYPRDIAYNAARVGSFYFHNLKHTDRILREELENAGAEPVHVEQGYTKCSIAVVDEGTIITSDAGIARAAEKKGVRVLLIGPARDILLPGLDMGFIGGATGLVDRRRLAVNGNARALEAYVPISRLLSEKNCELLSLSGSQVVDTGSLIPLMTV
jgi:hypothetical protein